jgi:hypothetical protein
VLLKYSWQKLTTNGINIQDRINVNKAKAIALQDKLDKQFARDTKVLIAKDIIVSIYKTRSQALTIEENKHLVSSPLASILIPARRVRKK